MCITINMLFTPQYVQRVVQLRKMENFNDPHIFLMFTGLTTDLAPSPLSSLFSSPLPPSPVMWRDGVQTAQCVPGDRENRCGEGDRPLYGGLQSWSATDSRGPWDKTRNQHRSWLVAGVLLSNMWWSIYHTSLILFCCLKFHAQSKVGSHWDDFGRHPRDEMMVTLPTEQAVALS